VVDCGEFSTNQWIGRVHVPKLLAGIKLSLPALAKEFKLKRGFKELFGTTVFNYLSEIRLEQVKIYYFCKGIINS
jgi:AraC-like DNA-binding protein